MNASWLPPPAISTAAAWVLVLAGCMGSRAPMQQYDLGDWTSRPLPSESFATTIVVRDVTTPIWLETRDMSYRLDYERPPHPRRYATSQWVASPGELLSTGLRQALSAANTGYTLSAPNGSDAYFLQTTLEEFTQTFVAPNQSRCIVQLRASLSKPRDRIIVQQVFRSESQAPSANASGGVSCLTAAGRTDVADIVAWVRHNAASG